MKKTILTNIAFAFTIVFIGTGCKKHKEEDATPSSTNANITAITAAASTDNAFVADYSTADGDFSDIFKTVSEAADTSSVLKSSSCPTITISPLSGWPKTLNIDYGTVGCKNKKGKLIAVLSGPFRTPGSTITITSVKYSDHADTIDVGTHTITNQGNNLAGNQYFSVDVVGAVIKNPSGKISWNSHRTIEWIAGDDTPLIPDDNVYLISGTGSGTSVKGVEFTVSISTPLRIDMGCQWIESGVISITPDGKEARVIDFGSGTCDNDATVAITGVTGAIPVKI